jgi:4-amino-4-deoxy-L-arabinose transferase-like glycosyltransferase
VKPSLLALIAFLVATPLLLVNTAGKAIQNGDEAIYAQMAREMAERGTWGELTWQGEPQFPRPPGAIWILAVARKLLGDERTVRWPLAAAAGTEIAFVILLGAALWDRRAGLVAGGVLLTSDLFIGYARYLESEPFLCAFVVAAIWCWVRARKQPGFVWGWGAFLGCALMTKQIIGGLPLLMPFIDRVQRDEPPIAWRRVGRGLAIAALIWLPWHVFAIAKHGRAFVDSYFLSNVIERASSGILRTTRPTFYVRELWRSEGVLGVIAGVAVGWAFLDGVRRRKLPDLLIACWALGPFVVFSLAASRYDHYLLLAYPALALAAAQLLAIRLPLKPPVRYAMIAAWLCAGAWLHLARDLSAFEGDEEVRTLARAASSLVRPPALLLTYNTHAYSARYYATVDVLTLLESPDDFRIANELKRTGLPIAVEAAPDLAANLRTRARPFALLMPRARASLLDGVPVPTVGESRHYLLVSGQ